MGLAEQAVLVRVPATSANLGPGFDTLGLALGLHDEIEARATGTGLDIEVSGEGGAELAEAGERHLVVRAMRVAFDELDVPQPPGLTLRCRNRIPHGRGLGSSAAAIVAGLLAARALAGAGTDPEEVLPLATMLEGHPDNVAPCLYGGLTIAWTADHAGGLPRPHAVRLEPHPGIYPVVLVAPGAVPTKVARGLLPEAVPHADAARNAGRAALLVAVLSGGPGLSGGAGLSAGTGLTADLAGALLAATEDRLHQDYRAPAMPQTHELVARLRAAGVPAVVSGAGPSVLALLPAKPGREELRLLDSAAGETGIEWHISPLAVERQGASVVPSVSGAR